MLWYQHHTSRKPLILAGLRLVRFVYLLGSMEAQMDKNWSDQQTAIFDFVANGKGNLVVRARAGTGKTTTGVEALNHAPKNASRWNSRAASRRRTSR